MLGKGKGLWRRFRGIWTTQTGIPEGVSQDSDTSDEDQPDHATAVRPDNLDAGARADEAALSATGISLPFLPERVAWVLASVAVSLALLSFMVGLIWFAGVGPWIRVVNVDNDLSLPSWFSAVLLLFSSVLLSAIAYAKRLEANPRYRRHWAVLAIIFLFLSCDEMIRLHERMANVLVRPALDALGIVPTGMLSNPWVLVYGPLVLIFVLAYLRFWLDLSARVKTLFFAAGTLYVGGALGVELATAWYNAAGNDFGIFLTTHLEELMEMLGAIVFAHALMSYIQRHLHVREVKLQ